MTALKIFKISFASIGGFINYALERVFEQIKESDEDVIDR